MSWTVEYTDEFESWWNGLEEADQAKVEAYVARAARVGPQIFRFRRVRGVNGSRHTHMRELRIQVRGRPFRVLYAFNPQRAAILLLGGDKTGDNRWYEVNVPIADRSYDRHLLELERERNKEVDGDG